jgi:phosphate/sulfate permease
MIWVGTFELEVGLSLAALIVYFAFRNQESSLVLVLLVVALAPILGIVIAAFLAYALNALFLQTAHAYLACVPGRPSRVI